MIQQICVESRPHEAASQGDDAELASGEISYKLISTISGQADLR